MISSFPTCPIPEVARLGRTLKQWKTAILAYLDTNGASNGPTEAVNGVIETTRRIARGFRNFPKYRIRCLLAAGPTGSNRQTMPECEGPAIGGGFEPVVRESPFNASAYEVGF
ncbi:hypothetical protein SRABI83_00041 [Arthrobacter sp. Bi83]|nr:hypothetical protein SRABI83_00041 [Arthrobacter sp. Bi83]